MPLEHLTERLTAFEPSPFPVVSLYLNTEPDDTGRDHFQAWLRKELNERLKTFPPRSEERESFERDAERIQNYVKDQLQPSANGLAVFACAGEDDFFEAVQLDAPLPNNRLFVSTEPHLYPLARLMDQYPRYAAVVADSNSARIFVFSLGRVERTEEVAGEKVNRTKVGGWSQARYQRRVDNFHEQHIKEVVETLNKLVTDEGIERVVLACDEVVLPLLREQMPQQLAEKVIDVLKLDISTAEADVLKHTLEALRRRDAEDDAEKVKRVFEEYRANGLAVAGAREVLAALEIGQVDELVISADRAAVRMDDEVMSKPLAAIAAASEAMKADAQASAPSDPQQPVALADELVNKAQQTGARVSFIENAELLSSVGGVGALLRFRL
jgi:peptide subunit release factor 1 (eRF1)